MLLTMAKKGKKYRGQRVQKSYMYGCGCFICTGHDKEGRMNITEKLIDKEALEEVNDFILPDVIKCQCNHKIEDRFPTELLMKECEDCNGVLTFLKMKELTKEQKIELYDLIYPKSLENDDDIKANDMTNHLKDNDSLILLWTDIKKISDWMIKNGL